MTGFRKGSFAALRMTGCCAQDDKRMPLIKKQKDDGKAGSVNHEPEDAIGLDEFHQEADGKTSGCERDQSPHIKDWIAQVLGDLPHFKKGRAEHGGSAQKKRKSGGIATRESKKASGDDCGSAAGYAGDQGQCLGGANDDSVFYRQLFEVA